MPTNRDRATWAAEALDTFQARTGVDAEDAVCDLLCDLMHFCNYAAHTGGFEASLQRARMHNDAELDEEAPNA